MIRVLLSVAALALAGCGGEATSGTSSTSGAGSTSSSGTGSTAPMGHAITLNAKFVVEDGQVGFLTPGVSVVKVPPESIVGKHYLVGVYPPGFSAGNDLPIDSTWGTVPESLSLSFTTPATYKDGPYDVVLVAYRSTEITPEITSKSISDAPAAQKGDVATFRLDTGNVHMGDPPQTLGTIRVNVAGADLALDVENRWPRDVNNGPEVTAAFNDTILLIP